MPDSYVNGQFSWVDLTAHDKPSAQSFYEKLFGWSTTEIGPEGMPYGQFSLDGKSTAGIGQMNEQMKSGGMPPIWSSYISVDDADAVLANATELGGTVTVPVMDIPGDAGRLAFFQDPTGGNVGIWQPGTHKGAQLSNEPNSFCWNELATRDIGRAKEFYGSLFGWQFQDHAGAPTPYLIIMNNDRPNGGLMQMNEEWGEIPPHWMVYFAASDTTATAAKVSELGGKVQVEPFDTEVGKIAVVSDPQGGTFSLIQLKAPTD